MKNLLGEEYDEIPRLRKDGAVDKERRAWESAFQRWSNRCSLDGSSPLGCCGYGRICDYCTDAGKGRPCVRALNAMVKEKGMKIDYSHRDFEKWFMGADA